ncbi:adenylate kinase-domain-containing protein [Catenaria anguillulae PL171]|uniref:Adenylate kinase-domain-containing protein n=1 Tax=Catenaria anguillulae PL171 TaxID=765915 RepID=A0A1Y2I6F2_9FUNG|nr:adenylate kinase-domain-containing protein [Catenaria anguillulae PL171]
MNATDVNLLESVTQSSLGKFAQYADQHDLSTLIHDLVKRLVVAKPDDPLPWLATELEKRPLPAICVLAPPTADDSDLCKSLASATNAVYISASSLLKVAIERKSTLGVQALPALAKNQLVPDRVMIELVMMRLGQPDVADRGWVLEGFPRTREQAIGLQRRGVLPSHVFVLEMNDRDLLDRNAQIYVDPVTNTEYDLRKGEAGMSAEVRARLIHKTSLSEANVMDRLGVYRRHLPGILDVLKAHVKLDVPRDASCAAPEVVAQVVRALQVRRASGGGLVGGGNGFHRIVLVGGSAQVKEKVGQVLEESGPHLVYVSPRRVYTEEISRRGPNAEKYLQVLKGQETLNDDELISMLVTRTSQPDCTTQGWILTCDTWTPGLLQAISIHLAPSRVLLLPSSPASNTTPESDAVKTVFTYPIHPFFEHAAAATAGTKSGSAAAKKSAILQDVEVLDGVAAMGAADEVKQVAERVRQLLLRPIEWKVPTGLGL